MHPIEQRMNESRFGSALGNVAMQSSAGVEPGRPPELPGVMARVQQSSEALVSIIESLDNRLSGVVARPSSPTPTDKQIKGAMNTGMGAELDGLNDRLGQAYARVSSLLDRLEF